MSIKIRNLFFSIFRLSPLSYGFVYLSLILIFWVLFYNYGKFAGSGWSEDSMGLDYLYFSVVTITTLGYGDIHPLGGWTRALCIIEVVLGILTIGLFLNSISQNISKNAEMIAEKKIKVLRDRVYVSIASSPDKLMDYLFRAGVIKRVALNEMLWFGKQCCWIRRFKTELNQILRPSVVEDYELKLSLKEMSREKEELTIAVDRFLLDIKSSYEVNSGYLDSDLLVQIYDIERACERFNRLLSDPGSQSFRSEEDTCRFLNNHIFFITRSIDKMNDVLLSLADSVMTSNEFREYMAKTS